MTSTLSGWGMLPSLLEFSAWHELGSRHHFHFQLHVGMSFTLVWRLGKSRGLGRPAATPRTLSHFLFVTSGTRDEFVCFHPRIGWVVSFVAKPIQPMEEVESHCVRVSRRNPKWECRQGLMSLRQHFLPLLNIDSLPFLFNVPKMVLPI